MNRRTKYIVLALSGLAVIGVALLSRPAVPLYDGVNFPDEPYRYADRSHKPVTALPDSQTVTFTRSEIVYGLSLISNEQGPQLSVYIDNTAIRLSPSAVRGIVRAQAIVPDTQPPGDMIDGNVYRISGSADSGTFSITKAGNNTFNSIQLRLPQGSPPKPVMEFRPLGTTAWQQIGVDQIGNDIYQSTIDNFGDYALATPKGTQSTGRSPSIVKPRSMPYIAIALGVLVVLMAASVAFIRLRQHRKASRT